MVRSKRPKAEEPAHGGRNPASRKAHTGADTESALATAFLDDVPLLDSPEWSSDDELDNPTYNKRFRHKKHEEIRQRLQEEKLASRERRAKAAEQEEAGRKSANSAAGGATAAAPPTPMKVAQALEKGPKKVRDALPDSTRQPSPPPPPAATPSPWPPLDVISSSERRKPSVLRRTKIGRKHQTPKANKTAHPRAAAVVDAPHEEPPSYGQAAQEAGPAEPSPIALGGDDKLGSAAGNTSIVTRNQERLFDASPKSPSQHTMPPRHASTPSQSPSRNDTPPPQPTVNRDVATPAPSHTPRSETTTAAPLVALSSTECRPPQPRSTRAATSNRSFFPPFMRGSPVSVRRRSTSPTTSVGVAPSRTVASSPQSTPAATTDPELHYSDMAPWAVTTSETAAADAAPPLPVVPERFSVRSRQLDDSAHGGSVSGLAVSVPRALDSTLTFAEHAVAVGPPAARCESAPPSQSTLPPRRPPPAGGAAAAAGRRRRLRKEERRMVARLRRPAPSRSHPAAPLTVGRAASAGVNAAAPRYPPQGWVAGMPYDLSAVLVHELSEDSEEDEAATPSPTLTAKQQQQQPAAFLPDTADPLLWREDMRPLSMDGDVDYVLSYHSSYHGGPVSRPDTHASPGAGGDAWEAGGNAAVSDLAKAAAAVQPRRLVAHRSPLEARRLPRRGSPNSRRSSVTSLDRIRNGFLTGEARSPSSNPEYSYMGTLESRDGDGKPSSLLRPSGDSSLLSRLYMLRLESGTTGTTVTASASVMGILRSSNARRSSNISSGVGGSILTDWGCLRGDSVAGTDDSEPWGFHRAKKESHPSLTKAPAALANRRKSSSAMYGRFSALSSKTWGPPTQQWSEERTAAAAAAALSSPQYAREAEAARVAHNAAAVEATVPLPGPSSVCVLSLQSAGAAALSSPVVRPLSLRAVAAQQLEDTKALDLLSPVVRKSTAPPAELTPGAASADGEDEHSPYMHVDVDSKREDETAAGAAFTAEEEEGDEQRDSLSNSPSLFPLTQHRYPLSAAYGSAATTEATPAGDHAAFFLPHMPAVPLSLLPREGGGAVLPSPATALQPVCGHSSRDYLSVSSVRLSPPSSYTSSECGDSASAGQAIPPRYFLEQETPPTAITTRKTTKGTLVGAAEDTVGAGSLHSIIVTAGSPPGVVACATPASDSVDDLHLTKSGELEPMRTLIGSAYLTEVYTSSLHLLSHRWRFDGDTSGAAALLHRGLLPPLHHAGELRMCSTHTICAPLTASLEELLYAPVPPAPPRTTTAAAAAPAGSAAQPESSSIPATAGTSPQNLLPAWPELLVPPSDPARGSDPISPPSMQGREWEAALSSRGSGSATATTTADSGHPHSLRHRYRRRHAAHGVEAIVDDAALLSSVLSSDSGGPAGATAASPVRVAGLVGEPRDAQPSAATHGRPATGASATSSDGSGTVAFGHSSSTRSGHSFLCLSGVAPVVQGATVPTTATTTTTTAASTSPLSVKALVRHFERSTGIDAAKEQSMPLRAGQGPIRAVPPLSAKPAVPVGAADVTACSRAMARGAAGARGHAASTAPTTAASRASTSLASSPHKSSPPLDVDRKGVPASSGASGAINGERSAIDGVPRLVENCDGTNSSNHHHDAVLRNSATASHPQPRHHPAYEALEQQPVVRGSPRQCAIVEDQSMPHSPHSPAQQQTRGAPQAALPSSSPSGSPRRHDGGAASPHSCCTTEDLLTRIRVCDVAHDAGGWGASGSVRVKSRSPAVAHRRGSRLPPLGVPARDGSSNTSVLPATTAKTMDTYADAEEALNRTGHTERSTDRVFAAPHHLKPLSEVVAAHANAEPPVRSGAIL